jgi:hypothetical protein
MKNSFVVKSVLMTFCFACLVFSGRADVVAYWDFSSDTNGVTDISGNRHTLVNNGVIISNGAAVFNGNHTAFNTSVPLNLSAYSAVTLELWLKTESSDQTHVIFELGKSVFNAGGLQMLLNYEQPGQLYSGYFSDFGEAYRDYTDPSISVTDGEWHHIAMVADRSAADSTDRVKLYFDGELQSTETFDGTNTPVFKKDTLYISSRRNESVSAGLYMFLGELDDIRISNAALAPDEFMQERTEGMLPVVARWNFDEGTELTDASGNGNSLSASGVVFTGGVARLNGAHTAFSTADTLDLTAQTNLTVEYFIRTADPSLAVVLEQSANYNQNIGCFINALDDSLVDDLSATFRAAGGGTGYHRDRIPYGRLTDGQWHHVAWVHDSTLATIDRWSLYLDGVQQPQDTTKQNLSLPALCNHTFYIGSRANSLYKFTGELDDLRITGRALNPVQFQKVPSTELLPELIAYWPFSPDAPTEDLSGNGHSLSNDGVTFSRGAAIFDGNFSDFSTAGTLNLRPYSALTIEYFIRALEDDNTFTVIEHSPNYVNNRGGFTSNLNYLNAGQLQGGFSFYFATYNVDATSAGAVTDGAWHHVALVYDPDSDGADRVRLYFDGEKQLESVYANDQALDFLNAKLYIGSRANSNNKFIGELDDVRITGAALAPEEFMTACTAIPEGTLIFVL